MLVFTTFADEGSVVDSGDALLLAINDSFDSGCL